jgi:hypothetical protein
VKSATQDAIDAIDENVVSGTMASARPTGHRRRTHSAQQAAIPAMKSIANSQSGGLSVSAV